MPRTKQSRLIEALSEPLADKQVGVKVTRRKLSDYKLDPRNSNKGTERGNYMLNYSVEEFGPARSGVADADGIIRAGNHTAEQLAEAGIEDVIEVTTTGKEWVVVKREDMTGDIGKRYAVSDNRTAQVGIDYDADVLREMTESGLDLSQFFHEDELSEILNVVPNVTFPEYDETTADDVKYCTCPNCGHKFPQ